jgi:hypothetical protein
VENEWSLWHFVVQYSISMRRISTRAFTSLRWGAVARFFPLGFLMFTFDLPRPATPELAWVDAERAHEVARVETFTKTLAIFHARLQTLRGLCRAFLRLTVALLPDQNVCKSGTCLPRYGPTGAYFPIGSGLHHQAENTCLRARYV